MKVVEEYSLLGEIGLDNFAPYLMIANAQASKVKQMVAYFSVNPPDVSV